MRPLWWYHHTWWRVRWSRTSSRTFGGRKPWWFILWFLLLVIWGYSLVSSRTFDLPDTVTIPTWGGYSTLLDELSGLERLRFSWRLRSAWDDLPVVQPGSYFFGDARTWDDVVSVIAAWPSITYVTVTFLEGWSSYDIDAWLARNYIEPGAYRRFVTNHDIIRRYQERYPFLREEFLWHRLESLEGFLYPDTYKVDASKDIIDQVVFLQLENRKQKLWLPYEEQRHSLQQSLQSRWYSFRLSPYEALILASIVDKEEPTAANKPLVTSIFFNRLETGMQIDADISLCYGLWQPYSFCTPEVIVRHLRDSNNLRNTRARAGLPPTPITNPDVSSVAALFSASPTQYFFYLHDPQGRLHPSVTLTEHNQKVRQYLR